MRRVGIYAGHSTAHPLDITECEMNGVHTFTALANEQTAAMLGMVKAESGLQRYWLILCVAQALISKAFSWMGLSYMASRCAYATMARPEKSD